VRRLDAALPEPGLLGVRVEECGDRKRLVRRLDAALPEPSLLGVRVDAEIGSTWCRG